MDINKIGSHYLTRLVMIALVLMWITSLSVIAVRLVVSKSEAASVAAADINTILTRGRM